MAEDRTAAPSAEELKDRMDKLGAQEDSGVGEQEPDPATAENPPGQTGAGDEKRTQT
jgi:hypothetical protein